MRINPISFAQTIPINNIKQESSVQKENENNLVTFPKGYGYTNIAFCGRNNRKSGAGMGFNEYYKQCQKVHGKPAAPIKEELPVFQPYGNSVIDAVKNITSKGTCLIMCNSEIDSKELFIANLQNLIRTDRIKALGFDKDTPFVHINLSDYADDTTNAAYEMRKDFNKQLKGHKTPIVLVDGVQDFFDKVDRPNEFVRNSIFRNNPTIFFAEEGFNIFKADDIKTINMGLTPMDERPDGGQYLNEGEFQHLLSKVAFINGSKSFELPPVATEDLLEYLSKPVVQRQLLTRGNDIKFEEGCIEFAFELGKSISYFKDHYYNVKHKQRLIERGKEAVNLTIDVLRSAAMLKLILNPNAKEVKINDLTNALPSNIDFFKTLICFNQVKETAQANAENSPEKKEITAKAVIGREPEKPKETEETDPENADETQEDKGSKEAKETTTEKKEQEHNFEVIQNPKTRFSDVGGMYNIKKQLKEEFLDILKNPRVKNNQKPSGILLSGPPGCGKTLLARAIAGEAGVPFISTVGSSFIEMYVGVGPKRVRELFAQAKEEAKKHPSKTAIVFIDEVDAVAGSRKNNGSSEDLRTINALLHEMDGVNNKDEQDLKIITIVATNHEGMIDDAFKRSGRIDLKYVIDDPRYSVKAREEILKIHSQDLTFRDDKDKAKMIKALAQTTAGLSGADLAELLKKANRMSLNVHRINNYITEEDIKEAQMQIRAGIKTDMEHTDFELKQTIAHEAGHAVTSMVLEKIFEKEVNKHKMPNRVLDFITNSARGNALGATYFKPSDENKLGSKETCLADLITLYGGYAIEAEMFDTHSSGISNDLKQATELIENAVALGDFGSEKRYLTLNTELTKSLFSEEIKSDIINFAQKGMSLSKEIIKFTRPFIEDYVQNLLSDKHNLDRTVSSKEFKEQFNKWLKNSRKSKQYKELCESVKSQIDGFCKEQKERTKIGY